MRLDDLDAEAFLDSGNTRSTTPEEHERIARLTSDSTKKKHLTGMYKDWFLDYASYVILERAVPHLDDGLKPVQRRILHAMKRLDDGRYNKVANIIGHTMQFHPHGDASIGDALVQLGQKDLLIDMQGNWGNILTGDSAAAPRYIEARLSKFAQEVVFNSKTTEWMLSYDGRNQEPVTLPVKFPLLLAQGVEGIAVGLASKILPHNFIELIDAAILYLKGKDFELFPDFPTAGLMECSRYNDGLRGGAVKVRARIAKIDRRTLAITEIPYGKTTTSLIDSIIRANDKGKIRIKKIDDNTAEQVEILVHLAPDISPDMTIDALYAFTDCEVSISTNACVIYDDKPRFMGVKEQLRASVDQTRYLLTRELEIRLDELEADWHFSSLEKIFFEQRIYRELEKDAETWDGVLEAIEKQFDPYRKLLRRSIIREDIVKLTEKPVRKISKFDIKKADEHIRGVEGELDEVKNHLANIVPYTINYFQTIKKRYGKGRERRTEIRSFDTIEAAKVVVANQKLYVNKAEGFFGTGLKKETFVADCSDMDEVIVILKNGKYSISKVQDKAFFGKDIEHIALFKRNDERTIYNVLYRDGRNGDIMMKRCAISGITRDREYDLTKGTEGSQLLFLSANPNGEIDILKVYLKPKPRLRNLILELDFGQLAVKGRGSMGNIFTRHAIHKIIESKKIVETTSTQEIWFDWDVFRLNADGRGALLGEFAADDKLLAIYKTGEFKLLNYDPSTHVGDNLMHLEKFDPDKVYTAIYFEGEQKFYYIKRFAFEASEREVLFIADTAGSYLVELNSDAYPCVKVVFGGKQSHREPESIDVEQFIGVKSYRAKGKRITTHPVKTLGFIEPLEKEPIEEPQPEQEQSSKPEELDASRGFPEQMTLDI